MFMVHIYYRISSLTKEKKSVSIHSQHMKPGKEKNSVQIRLSTSGMMKDENVYTRLRWLMVSRIAIITFILGVAIFLQTKGEAIYSEIHLPHLYIVIGITYFLSIVYYFIQNTTDNTDAIVYIQALLDVVVVTGLVYATGGIRSIYAAFYPLIIIYTTVFLVRRGGLIIASACSIMYGLLLNLEFYGILSPAYVFFTPEYQYSAGYFLTRITVNIISFYIIAMLASFLVERERRTRSLLVEKETAFDQLDLLHRSIIESVDAGIITVNLRGNIKSFNSAAEEIIGSKFSEVENRSITDVLPDFSEKMDMMEKAGSSQTRFEVTINRDGLQEAILTCSVSPLMDGGKNRIGDIIIFQNITSIKRMEEAVERSRRMAFIGEMAAGLAHEMRNPLASISGSIQLLRKVLPLTATDRRLMDIILRGKDQLENFMSDFLVLSRPTIGIREEFNVPDIVEDVLEAIRLTPDWNEEIRVEKSLSPESRIDANKKEIRQIIWNLMTNAVQAMPSGGCLHIATAGISGSNGERYLELLVADNGCGIKVNDLPKVFEPFYTTKETGTGLGLAVVNKIVERYNGRITIESNENSGTACRVWLPLPERG